MNTHIPALLKALLLGVFISFASCKKEESDLNPPYRLPGFILLSETTIMNHLERPSGLAFNPNPGSGQMKSAGDDLNISGIYAEGPVYHNFHNEGGFQKYKNPHLSGFSGKVDDITVAQIAEIELQEYLSDFNSYVFYALPDSLWRPRGLTVDGLILKNEMILMSSSSSDKIFSVSSTGEVEIFVQNEMLYGITDMIESSDGKIYAVQAPVFYDNDPSSIVFPKRVISIENGSVNVEFELPSDIISNPQIKFQDHPDWYVTAQYREKLKIVENSEHGKEEFGARFYIADLLADVIYKVDDNNTVSTLAGDLRYPTSIMVDSQGNIYYTNSPLFGGYREDGDWTKVSFVAELLALNPESGQSVVITEFGSDLIRDYHMCADEYIGVKGMNNGHMDSFILPLGYSITSILVENGDEINFFATDSHLGTLKQYIFDTEASSE